MVASTKLIQTVSCVNIVLFKGKVWANFKIYRGAIIFLVGGGPSVMAGRQVFLVPTFAYAKKSGPPLCLLGKILVPPLAFGKNFVPPPPPLKEHPSDINNGCD